MDESGDGVADGMSDGVMVELAPERRLRDRRRSDRRTLGQPSPVQVPGDDRLWHVTVTVAGSAVALDDVRAGLERLSMDHPFLLSGRYAVDRAEVRYWEEAPDVHDALAMALRLWGEHRVTAGLPSWSIVGLEVVDRETHRVRGGPSPLVSPGVKPF